MITVLNSYIWNCLNGCYLLNNGITILRIPRPLPKRSRIESKLYQIFGFYSDPLNIYVTLLWQYFIKYCKDLSNNQTLNIVENQIRRESIYDYWYLAIVYSICQKLHLIFSKCVYDATSIAQAFKFLKFIVLLFSFNQFILDFPWNICVNAANLRIVFLLVAFIHFQYLKKYPHYKYFFIFKNIDLAF